MSKNDFSWWQNALTGTRGQISADDPEPGFYENRRKDKVSGKVSRDLVAYWHDSNDGELRCHRNGRDVDDLRAREMWPYASKYPVPEHTYRDVLGGQPWPDEASAVNGADEDDGEKSPTEKIIADITKARADRENYKKIDSDEQSGRGQSLRSLLTTLSGKLDKEREALVRPHLDAQRDINSRYNPIIKAAKDDADAIKKALEAWEDDKREAARVATAAAQKAADEENARLAAIHQQKSDDAEQFNEPAPPPPAPVAPAPQSNMPAPAAQIRGGAGRAASVSTWHEVVIDDEAAVYAHLKGAPELTALILQLAQKAVNAGLTVPGTHTVEKTRVR